MKTFNRSTACLVLFSMWALILADGAKDKKPPLIELRHKAPKMDRSANLVFPRYSESALMVSPCHPEEDGYFGGTYGSPVHFEYLFEMESSPNANLGRALLQIRDSVVDGVVADTFPQLCGSRRLLEEVERTEQTYVNDGSFVSGFRFGETPKMELSQSCEPILSDANNCGMYKSNIAVFGHSLESDDAISHIMQTVLDHISYSRINVAPLGVKRLVPSEKNTRIIDDPTGGLYDNGLVGSPTGTSLTPLAKTGLVLSALALIGGIVVLVMYVHMDSKGKREPVKTLDTGETRKGWLSLLRFRLFSSAGKTHIADESEKSCNDSIYLDEYFDHSDRRVLLHLDAGFNVDGHMPENDSLYSREYVLD